MDKVTMDDGQEITLTYRSGTIYSPVTRRLGFWQASTKQNDTAFGATEEAALAALYDKQHPISGDITG